MFCRFLIVWFWPPLRNTSMGAYVAERKGCLNPKSKQQVTGNQTDLLPFRSHHQLGKTHLNYNTSFSHSNSHHHQLGKAREIMLENIHPHYNALSRLLFLQFLYLTPILTITLTTGRRLTENYSCIIINYQYHRRRRM